MGLSTGVEKIWESAQERLRGMLNADTYNLWFAPLRVTELEANRLTLQVANDFCQVWLTDNYLELIQEVLAVVTGQSLEVTFVIAQPESDVPPTDGKLFIPSPPSREPVPNNGSASRDHGLNPNYIFDNFVVGSSNNFAHAAAVAVAQSPGKSYNPLFVYGGTGLGKTHLLHAIGQHVVTSKRRARVAYITSEKFTNEYIDAIQNSQLVKFRRKYRQMDLLLIDDIHFLAGKERIQEEFFHTFNALHEARKQIVMTSDQPATTIKNLEQRLVSRFEWGLVTDLQAPDVETRVAILRKKEASLGAQLPDEIIVFLAERIRNNIRRLEGALVRVASFAALMKRDLTVQIIEELLNDVIHEEGKTTVTVEVIQKRVADQYDLRLADMTSRRRPENIAFPRQIAMYLARELTDLSFSAIGEAFGGRDHGTVLHACRLVKDRMEVEAQIRQVVTHLKKQLHP